MKKLFALLLAAGLCLGLAACAAGTPEPAAPAEPVLSAPGEPTTVSQPLPGTPEPEPEPEPVWTAAEGVTFSLLRDTCPANTARLTLIVDNRSGGELSWGTYESYEKYVDGRWEPIPYPEDTGFRDLAFVLEPNAVRTVPLTGLALLPPLEEGLYRVTGSAVTAGEEALPPWQVSFRVAAEAPPEPDYALYIAAEPIPTVEGCGVTDRIPGFFINTTGESAEVLLIPHLERLDENGAWEEVPWREGVGFCGTPDPLPPEGKPWSWEISFLWGSLPDGRYRIGVDCQPYQEEEETVYGEFTLFTPENSADLPLAPGE